MRISDWSSDVCSSDLRMWATPAARLWVPLLYRAARLCQRMLPTLAQRLNAAAMRRLHTHQALSDIDLTLLPGESLGIIGLNGSGTSRSEERRVGKECVRTCRAWWSQSPYKQNINP